MTRLFAAAGALVLLSAAGAAAATGPAAVHAACSAPAGAIVVTPDADAVQRDVATPVGALNLVGEIDLPDVYVDLGGRPVGSTADLQLVLAWDNPVSDYDLVVAGENDLSTDNPEAKGAVVEHCTPLSLAVEVFVGAPVDAITLATSAAQTEAE